MTNPHASAGAGRARKTYRIKEWMDLNGLIQKDVAAQAGVKTHAVVSRTIRGSVNNRKVLRALKDLGCPEAYLALPKDMKEEAA